MRPSISQGRQGAIRHSPNSKLEAKQVTNQHITDQHLTRSTGGSHPLQPTANQPRQLTTDRAQSVCPSISRSSAPSDTLQARAVESPLTVTQCFPSRVSTASFTHALWPCACEAVHVCVVVCVTQMNCLCDSKSVGSTSATHPGGHAVGWHAPSPPPPHTLFLSLAPAALPGTGQCPCTTHARCGRRSSSQPVNPQGPRPHGSAGLKRVRTDRRWRDFDFGFECEDGMTAPTWFSRPETCRNKWEVVQYLV